MSEGTSRANSDNPSDLINAETTNRFDVLSDLAEDIVEEASSNDEAYSNSEVRPRRKRAKKKNTKVTVENAEDTPTLKVCSSSLRPAKLFKINIKIKDGMYDALIDTGASSNLMKSSIAKKLNLVPNKEKKTNILGLGMVSMGTEGKVYIDVEYYGIKGKNTSFDVIPDKTTDSSIVLGRKF